MELPPPLRSAVELHLEGVSLDDLRSASDRLSRRYRAETRDGRLHLDAELAVKAYLAARLPATYAAIRTSMEHVVEALPEFQPKTFLDVGAGPGSALWAARDCWDSIEDAIMVEASDAARRIGISLFRDETTPATRWIAGDATKPLAVPRPADLVTLSYVLDELAPEAIHDLAKRLWSLTAGVLLIIEPGTPAGWRRIMSVRQQLIAMGANVAAPCPHREPCPLLPPDWCHFARRVARSRIHRLTKNADVPWEDEKFIYLAASRMAAENPEARILAPPQTAKGRIELKLCRQDASMAKQLITRRDGEAYKAAKRLDWGDTITLP